MASLGRASRASLKRTQPILTRRGPAGAGARRLPSLVARLLLRRGWQKRVDLRLSFEDLGPDGAAVCDFACGEREQSFVERACVSEQAVQPKHGVDVVGVWVCHG